jgi:hypothetical protein
VFYAELATNDQITDVPGFFAAATDAGSYVAGQLTVSHISNSTYRAIAYQKQHGMIVDVRDPGLGNASIAGAYEVIPRTVTYNGVDYYVWVSTDPYMSQTGQAVNYILP